MYSLYNGAQMCFPSHIQYTLPIPLSHPRHESFKPAKQAISQDVTSSDGI